MTPPPPAVDTDTGFELDAQALEQRRAETRRHAATVQIPALRGFGFLVLCVIHAAHGAGPGAASTWALWALNLGYAFVAWRLLRAVRSDAALHRLGLLLFHVDLVVWLVNVQQLEAQHGLLYFGYFLLARVVDQVGFGVRRTLYFLHVVLLAYIGYAVVAERLDPALATAAERAGVAVTMYLLGLYFSAVALVTQRLRGRLRRAMTAARGLLATLGRRNEALRRQADELEQARAAAEQASVAKSQFLAMTSHEIRTPMNGVLGAMELLAGTPLSAEQMRYVRLAHRSGTALLALIDDLLDLSRIEAGRLQLRGEGFDLHAVLAEAVELMRIAAREKAIPVRLEQAADVPRWVRGDPLRLRQVLVNLLGNAVKFTDRGQVVLQASVRGPDGARLCLAVRDTGIGIPAGQRAAIFEAFQQVDSSSTRRHGGSGLGLAIVHDIVRLMGGTVAVESEPAVGSVFTVEIPLETVAAPPDADDAPPAPPVDPSLHVLLAEDDPVNQIVVAGMLERLGCRVDTAVDGAAAVASATGRSYDIVFMDCHMPVMDGWEATRRIRGHEGDRGARRVAIVALTADALPSERDRCLAAGMDDFVTKPVSSARLADVIATWTGRAPANPATQW